MNWLLSFLRPSLIRGLDQHEVTAILELRRKRGMV